MDKVFRVRKARIAPNVVDCKVELFQTPTGVTLRMQVGDKIIDVARIESSLWDTGRGGRGVVEKNEVVAYVRDGNHAPVRVPLVDMADVKMCNVNLPSADMR